MAIGDPISKVTTYGEVEDKVQIATGTLTSAFFSPSWYLKEISLSVQKVAAALNAAQDPFYLETNTSLTISGSANPYQIDLSSLSPFIDKMIRLVHIAGGTRTRVEFVPPHEAEDRGSMTNLFATSLWGVWEGDAVRLYKGSSFTINTGTDTLDLKYYRQPRVANVTRSTKLDVKDTAVQLVIDDMINKVNAQKVNTSV